MAQPPLPSLATGSAAFGGVEAATADLADARFLILPVPYDGTTTYAAGARFGPMAIIRASQQLELFDDELGIEPYHLGIATLEEVEICAAGPEQMLARIRRLGDSVLEKGVIPVMLGGEHLLSVGMIQAAAAYHRELSILHLDAHADLRKSYQGTPFSNACVMRLVAAHAPAVSVGIRSFSKEEHDFIQDTHWPLFPAAAIRGQRKWQEEVLALLAPSVYVTIDLDVFDPAEMPAVGTPEPGGLGWYDVLDLLRTVAGARRIVGADIMELCPGPGTSAAEFLAAKLVYKLIGYIGKQLPAPGQ